MKTILFIAALLYGGSVIASDLPPPNSAPVVKQENVKCVKKDKNGKCPPLPKSKRPTPKKVIPK